MKWLNKLRPRRRGSLDPAARAEQDRLQHELEAEQGSVGVWGSRWGTGDALGTEKDYRRP
jgi:hypothetical protein